MTALSDFGVSYAAIFLLSIAPAFAQESDPSWDSGAPVPPEIAAQQAAPAGTVEYDEGFRIRSADGRNEFIIEGLFQVTGRWDGAREPRSDFVLKRFRPEFAARIDDHYLFKLEPNFTEHDVELEEAWAGAELWHGSAVLRVGRMKAPFGLEEVRSRRNIDFPVFSILNQFSPAEDHGVFLYGLTPPGTLEWNAAVYNGTGAGDTGASKDVAGRVMLHPFADDDGSVWHGLQFGLAGTIGSQHESVAGAHVRNAARLTLTEYASGASLDGTRSRLGLEAAWFHGPWMAQAEALYQAQEMTGSGGSGRAKYSGAYLNVSHVLTGESKSFGALHPKSSVDPFEGTGRGAWVLAARVSHLRQGRELLDAGLVVPETYTEGVTTFSLGLNWVLSRHVTLRNSWLHSEYADPVDFGAGPTDREDTLMIELQMSF